MSYILGVPSDQRYHAGRAANPPLNPARALGTLGASCPDDTRAPRGVGMDDREDEAGFCLPELARQLRGRRRELRWTQAEVGVRVHKVGQQHQPRRWPEPISRSGVCQWESLSAPDEVGTGAERVQSFSLFTLACWAQALGLHLVVMLTHARPHPRALDERERRWLGDLLALPPAKRAAVWGVVDALQDTRTDGPVS